MIQANELRIGNIINHTNNSGSFNLDVIEVLKNGVKATAKMQLGDCFLRYEEINSIPLTEEWLLKFVFTFKDNGDDFDTYSLKSVEVWEHDDGFCHSYALGGDVLYVHQLKNLYFALTGSELVLSNVPYAIVSEQ